MILIAGILHPGPDIINVVCAVFAVANWLGVHRRNIDRGGSRGEEPL